MQEEFFYTCPCCWDQVSLLIEAYPEEQEFIEDCERCCRPLKFRLHFDGEEVHSFEVEADLD